MCLVYLCENNKHTQRDARTHERMQRHSVSVVHLRHENAQSQRRRRRRQRHARSSSSKFVCHSQHSHTHWGHIHIQHKHARTERPHIRYTLECVCVHSTCSFCHMLSANFRPSGATLPLSGYRDCDGFGSDPSERRRKGKPRAARSRKLFLGPRVCTISLACGLNESTDAVCVCVFVCWRHK